jgi:hypothetical protein
MKKLIYRYLSDVYYWKDISIRYKSDDKLVSIRDISKDLTLVFELTKKETKWYLKGWYKKTNKSFSFNKAWNYAWQNNIGYNIDDESEITRILSEEISNAIDREIINRMLNFTSEKINT